MFRSCRRGAQPIGDILGELIARRGYAQRCGQQHLQDAWRKAVGEPGGKYTRVGALRCGVLEVLVTNSILLQELAGFHKHSLLEKLRKTLDSQEVRDIRFRLDDGA
jgi:predicted nucleic acid-binding Zn ribbon protein